MMARMPDCSLPTPSSPPNPSRLSISFWSRMAAVPAPSSPGAASDGGAALSCWVSSSAIACRPLLLNQHFLEQHVVHLHRRDGVDALQHLLAQAIDAARAA